MHTQSTHTTAQREDTPSVTPNFSQEDLRAEFSQQTGQATGAAITGEQLLNSPEPEQPYLLQPLAYRAGLICLAGTSDTGKSALSRQLAIAICTGRPEFLGFDLTAQHGSVIVYSTEDAAGDMRRLLQRQAGHIAPEQLAGLRFLFDSEQAAPEAIAAELAQQPADMVIIDAFADAYGGDLKDTQRIRAYLKPLHTLAQEHDCIIWFVHHTGKRTEGLAPSKNNLLSGQGMEAKMRLVLELRTDNTDPYVKHLCVVKGNYLPARMKQESYVLRFDETSLSFTTTGDRIPFEQLAKRDDNEAEKYRDAKAMKEAGNTYEQIAERLGYSSRGSVTKLFQRGERNAW